MSSDPDQDSDQGSTKYKRILLKLSGEALLGQRDYGIDPAVVARISAEIGQVRRLGVGVGLVIGGGNIFRGIGSSEAGLRRVTGDHLGMLATVMNGLAFRDALLGEGVPARVLSALEMPRVCEPFTQRAAEQSLDAGEVVILAGGTGNPYFTTDTAAALRAIELGCDILCKATKVDGVYDADPVKHPGAKRFEEISYTEVLERRLGVMDLTAISLCMGNGMPVAVFNLLREGNILALVRGEPLGSLVKE